MGKTKRDVPKNKPKANDPGKIARESGSGVNTGHNASKQSLGPNTKR